MLKKTTECPFGAGSSPKAPTWKPTVAGPDRLVGLGFRCWLAGYQTGDIECWELAWREYSEVLGLTAAKLALGELACWVRAVRNAARRPIHIYPASCRGFCHDESMAISLIAACQQNACPAARACAFALLGNTLVDEPLETGQAFGATLESLGQRLSAAPIYVEGTAPRGGEAAYRA
jgi:hypothetical protein